jgi:hypothetical protein
VTLVLIGTASLAGCGSGDVPKQRDMFRSRADCVVEWKSDRLCERVVGGPNDGMYFGPPYAVQGLQQGGTGSTSTSSGFRSSTTWGTGSSTTTSQGPARAGSRAVLTQRSPTGATAGSANSSSSTSATPPSGSRSTAASGGVSRGGFGSTASARSSSSSGS